MQNTFAVQLEVSVTREDWGNVKDCRYEVVWQINEVWDTGLFLEQEKNITKKGKIQVYSIVNRIVALAISWFP